jgi:hypothetical protein
MHRLSPTTARIVSLLALCALAGCAGDANPVRDMAAAVGAGPKTAATPDFVANSRPATIDYIPVGSSGAERPTAARTAEEVKAAEAEMDAIRTTNEAAAAVIRSGGAASAQPAKKKPGTPQN